MRALLLAAMAAFLMIPPAFAQTSEDLLTQPEQAVVAPAAAEQAVTPAAPTAKAAKVAHKKEVKATKKAAHKAHKKHQKAMKKASKKTPKMAAKKCAKAASARHDYVYSPKTARRAPTHNNRYVPAEQEETTTEVEQGNSVTTSGSGAPLYSTNGSLVTFGK
ncbi:MAG: hypothetical protein WC612_08450 [Bdellovibrionales bacterium]|jgi:membrane protein involved in colicin uptake